jgi:hypothetical protein
MSLGFFICDHGIHEQPTKEMTMKISPTTEAITSPTPQYITLKSTAASKLGKYAEGSYPWFRSDLLLDILRCFVDSGSVPNVRRTLWTQQMKMPTRKSAFFTICDTNFSLTWHSFHFL